MAFLAVNHNSLVLHRASIPKASVFLLLISGLLSLSGLIESIPAKTYMQAHSEAAVKAAFIYNFTKFVTWPSDRSSDDITVGMCCNGIMFKFLKRLDGKTSQKRTIRVIRVRGLKDLQGLNVLFFGKGSPEDEKFLAESIKGHVLTISEEMDDIEKGVIICLYNLDNRIRFDINLQSAKRSGLEISSRLLKLAHRVIK